MKRALVGCIVALVAVVAKAENQKELPSPFYVYKDATSGRENHGIPSGWMGATKSLKFNRAWSVNPKSGSTCIQVQYDVSKDSETSWAGIYFQQPANNWGNMKGGYNLSGFTKLKFWARGTGFIDKFMVGGISGQTEEGDSDEAYIESIDLTSEWKEYTIDLSKSDLKHIIGPFGFAINGDYNKGTVQLFLDDIRFEK